MICNALRQNPLKGWRPISIPRCVEKKAPIAEIGASVLSIRRISGEAEKRFLSPAGSGDGRFPELLLDRIGVLCYNTITVGKSCRL